MESERFIRSLSAMAMVGALALQPENHGMTRMGKPTRFNPPKTVTPEERAKRRAKKKAADVSRKKNRK